MNDDLNPKNLKEGEDYYITPEDIDALPKNTI